MSVEIERLVELMLANRLVAVRFEYPDGRIRYGIMNGGDEIVQDLTEEQYAGIKEFVGEQYDSVLYHGVKLSSCSPLWPKRELPF